MSALTVAVAHAMELGHGYSHGMVSYNNHAIYDQGFDNHGLGHEDVYEDHRLQRRSPLIFLPKVLLLKKLKKLILPV